MTDVFNKQEVLEEGFSESPETNSSSGTRPSSHERASHRKSLEVIRYVDPFHAVICFGLSLRRPNHEGLVLSHDSGLSDVTMQKT